MSRFAPEVLKVLAPAVEAARSAVAALEADDVPASLRRVRAHTGGRLPPPLIVSIVTALDEDEDFRVRAAAELPADHADAASAAFLTRDTGWWDRVAAAAADVRVAGVQRTADRAVAATEKATARHEEAVRRLKAARAELDAAREQPRPAAVGPLPSHDASKIKEMKARIAALEARVAADAEDRRDTEAMVARLRVRLKGLLRSKRTGTATGADPAVSLGGDPLAVARNLDLLAAAARPQGTGLVDAEPLAVPDPIGLPGGVRPDESAAIEWLISLDRPLTVLIDGYNVLFGMNPGRVTTGRARSQLILDLARLRRRAGAVRIVAVFDSSLPGDADKHVAAGGVEVIFADEDQLADDAIVELIASGRGPLVVVTSDRDLQSRAATRGARILFSEALTGWIGR